MRMYQKKYYNIPKHKNYGRCECGGMFVQNKKNNKIKCDLCGTYQPMEIKTITCIDCGKEVEVDAKANNRNRCDKCIEKARLDKYKRYNEKRKLSK